jgi:hypothetical protein
MVTERLLISIISFFLLTSCGLVNGNHDGIAGKEDIYAGIYSQGIEDSWFRACINPKESWLFTEVSDTTFYPTLFDKRKSLNYSHHEFYMELRGVPTKKGEYRGFFVNHDRGFEIKELIEMRVAKESGIDCANHINSIYGDPF